MYFYDKNNIIFRRMIFYTDTGDRTYFEADDANWNMEARSPILKIKHVDKGGINTGAGRCLICGFDCFILNDVDECCMHCNAIFEEADVVADSFKEKKDDLIKELKRYKAEMDAKELMNKTKQWYIAASNKWVASNGSNIVDLNGNTIPTSDQVSGKKKA